MSGFVRLVYASRANFQVQQVGGIELEVGRILIQSKRNNPRQGVVGGLYFSDGCFFQCLEGPSEAVEDLYSRLHYDPRHRDLKVLRRETIEQPSFAGWAMKYIPKATAVQALLSRSGRKGFDPYGFEPGLIDAMVDLLRQGQDGTVNAAKTDSGSNQPIPAARQARLRQWLVIAAALVVSGAVTAIGILA